MPFGSRHAPCCSQPPIFYALVWLRAFVSPLFQPLLLSASISSPQSITTLSYHRIIWVGKTLKDPPVQLPCNKQEHLQLSHIAQVLVQPDFQCLQRWGIHLIAVFDSKRPVAVSKQLYKSYHKTRLNSLFIHKNSPAGPVSRPRLKQRVILPKRNLRCILNWGHLMICCAVWPWHIFLALVFPVPVCKADVAHLPPWKKPKGSLDLQSAYKTASNWQHTRSQDHSRHQIIR